MTTEPDSMTAGTTALALARFIVGVQERAVSLPAAHDWRARVVARTLSFGEIHDLVRATQSEIMETDYRPQAERLWQDVCRACDCEAMAIIRPRTLDFGDGYPIVFRKSESQPAVWPDVEPDWGGTAA